MKTEVRFKNHYHALLDEGFTPVYDGTLYESEDSEDVEVRINNDQLSLVQKVASAFGKDCNVTLHCVCVKEQEIEDITISKIEIIDFEVKSAISKEM